MSLCGLTPPLASSYIKAGLSSELWLPSPLGPPANLSSPSSLGLQRISIWRYPGHCCAHSPGPWGRSAGVVPRPHGTLLFPLLAAALPETT